VPRSDAVGHLLLAHSQSQFRVHLRPERHHLRIKLAFVGLVDVVQYLSTLPETDKETFMGPAFKYLAAPSTHLISFRERGQVLTWNSSYITHRRQIFYCTFI
jgi:hypothetical protein